MSWNAPKHLCHAFVLIIVFFISIYPPLIASIIDIDLSLVTSFHGLRFMSLATRIMQTCTLKSYILTPSFLFTVCCNKVVYSCAFFTATIYSLYKTTIMTSFTLLLLSMKVIHISYYLLFGNYLDSKCSWTIFVANSL